MKLRSLILSLVILFACSPAAWGDLATFKQVYDAAKSSPPLTEELFKGYLEQCFQGRPIVMGAVTFPHLPPTLCNDLVMCVEAFRKEAVPAPSRYHLVRMMSKSMHDSAVLFCDNFRSRMRLSPNACKEEYEALPVAVSFGPFRPCRGVYDSRQTFEELMKYMNNPSAGWPANWPQ